jgi:hypothetical protein
LPGYGGPAGGGAGGDGDDEDGGLEVNIPGIPGQDYPIYSEVRVDTFSNFCLIYLQQLSLSSDVSL